MYGATIPDARIRRKRNVARRVLLRSRERLLWLWPQYFAKHDMATGRLKIDPLDRFDAALDAGAEDPGEQNTRGGDYWSDPGWGKAARQYHAARAGRLLVTEIEPQRLARLRELLANDISLDRAWRELNERDDQPAPQATVDARVYELRTNGLAALKNPSCRRRLADLSNGQLQELMAALIRARPTYPPVTDELLLALDETRR
jgi:hypothetical protein